MNSEAIFLELLDRHVAEAALRFRIGEREAVVGRTAAGGPNIPTFTVRVRSPRFFSRVLCYGNLGMGEAYMDGDFEMEDGTLHDFLTVLLRSRLGEKVGRDPRMALRVLGGRLANAVAGRGRNVRRHYDIGDELFESFLDPTLTYSCGYAATPDDDLDALQRQKLDRICRKLRLAPGDRLLDIGCGYGGLLIHAAREFGVTGVGVTISRRHHERATAIVAEQGLVDRIVIRFEDYRTVRGEFDKVVSVGMMEHVPRREYGRYLASIARVLAPQGIGLVHTIGRTRTTHDHDPFVQRYVFPDSDTPRLSEIAACLERSGLAILDVENMVRHYGFTVHSWLQRFRQNAATLDPGKYDAAFQRMWEYYLSCGIAAARAAHSALFQVLFAKDHAADRPLHRV